MKTTTYAVRIITTTTALKLVEASNEQAAIESAKSMLSIRPGDQHVISSVSDFQAARLAAFDIPPVTEQQA